MEESQNKNNHLKNYYIVYQTEEAINWMIVSLKYDLDSFEEIQKGIESIRSLSKKDSIVLLSWKELH
jgi:hypothetical protein